jgi:hypothetical protein
MHLADTDIVSRIEVSLDAPDMMSALDACLDVVRALGAWRMDIGPGSSLEAGHYDLYVIVRSPLLEGETVEQALRRAVTAQLDVMGLTGEEIEVVQREHGPFARVMTVTGESVARLVPGGQAFFLLAKQGRDPFDTEVEEAETEVFDPEEVSLTDEQLRGLAELVRVVTTAQVVVVGVVSGVDEFEARDVVRGLADRVRRAVLPGSVEIELGDPRWLEDGTIKVSALAGGSELAPEEAVVSAAAVLSEFTWSAPERLEVRPKKDYYASEATASGPVVRVEIHAAEGLGWFPIEPADQTGEK